MLSGPSSYPKRVSKESPSWIRSLNVWSTMRNLQRSTLSIFTGHLCQMTPTINRLFALYLLRIIFSASWDYHLLSFKLTTQGAVGFHPVNSPHSTTEELSILKTESKKPPWPSVRICYVLKAPTADHTRVFARTFLYWGSKKGYSTSDLAS